MEITRRCFLQGAAATGVALAASGLISTEAYADEEAEEEAEEAAEEEESAEGEAAAEEESTEVTAGTADGRVWGYSGPGDWLGTAPEITDIAEEIDVDVVVVGSGHAGTQAALAAAEEGAVVAVIEAQTEDVFTYYGEDIGAWNSQFAQDAGFPEYDLGEVTAEFITRSGGRCLPDIVRLYVQNSGETLDHMLEVSEEMGIDERCYTYDNTEDGYVIIQANMDYDKIEAGEDIYDCINYDNYPLVTGTKTWASCVQFMGEYNDEPIDGVAANSVLPEVEGACIAKAEELGATWYYGHTATELVQNDDGDVIGVIVEADDGSYIQFNTTMGVVMCGGDYAGNADMCWALLNEYMERNERSGGTQADFYSFMGGRDGSSVKMMCWAGAYIEPAPRGSMILGGGPSGPWGTNSMLWLNSEGKRFTNEGLISAAQTACSRQPEGIISCVTDAKWLQSVCNMGLEHGGPNGGRPQYYQDMIDGMNAIEVGPDGGQVLNCTIAERGYTTVYAADTLEELAEYLGYEDDAIDTFVASIEHYNELCEAGSDTDYGKDASMMIAVDEAPFYGLTTTQSDSPTPSMVTMSGVLTDKRLNVLDLNHNPIKGLYAAGNSLGGRYGLGYSTPCAGNSIGMAVTHGRLAGQFVCEEGGLTSADDESAEAEEEEASEGSYTAGTYTATATGIGEVTVTVTFDETSITEVELDVSNETETIGQAAADELIEQVLDAQSADIEGVSGATLTSTAVSTGVADCIAQASGSASSEEDAEEEEAAEEETEEEAEEEEEEETTEASGTYVAGTYTATATGIGEVTVTVTFDEDSIVEVELDVSNETETIGQAAADELIEQVLDAQSADIEGVSGATLTSTAVSTGVADCIEQATA